MLIVLSCWEIIYTEFHTHLINTNIYAADLYNQFFTSIQFPQNRNRQFIEISSANQFTNISIQLIHYNLKANFHTHFHTLGRSTRYAKKTHSCFQSSISEAGIRTIPSLFLIHISTPIHMFLFTVIRTTLFFRFQT